MNVNPDTVRNLLLTIKDKTKVNVDDLTNNKAAYPLMADCSQFSLPYFLGLCHFSGIITDSEFNNQEAPKFLTLTPKGEKFLSLIQDETDWKNLKTKTNEERFNHIDQMIDLALGL